MLSPNIENIFRRLQNPASGGVLNAEELQGMLDQFQHSVSTLPGTEGMPVVVVPADIRRSVMMFVGRHIPGISVLSFREIESDANLQTIGVVGGVSNDQLRGRHKMQVKKFIAKDMQEALIMVKEELGSDAIVFGSRQIRPKGMFGPTEIEVTAAIDDVAPPAATAPSGGFVGGNSRDGSDSDVFDVRLKTLRNEIRGLREDLRTEEFESAREMLVDQLEGVREILAAYSIKSVGGPQIGSRAFWTVLMLTLSLSRRLWPAVDEGSKDWRWRTKRLPHRERPCRCRPLRR